MKSFSNPEQLISQVKTIVESDRRSEIRLNANGGNCVLLVCDPSQEQIFINEMNSMLNGQQYQIIDLNSIIVSFAENNLSEIKSGFEFLQGSVEQIFKAPSGENRPDLYKYILSAIGDAYSAGKIPVLVRSGALYGTGIENIHLMENELVMKSDKPLIILYPATQEENQLRFLGTRPASKYRCMIVN